MAEDCGWERNDGTCDKPKGHAGRHRYFRWSAEPVQGSGPKRPEAARGRESDR